MNRKLRYGIMLFCFGASATVNADCVINGNQIECGGVDFDGIPNFTYENYFLHFAPDASMWNKDVLGMSPFTEFLNSEITVDQGAVITLNNDPLNDSLHVFGIIKENYVKVDGRVFTAVNSSFNKLFTVDSNNTIVNGETGQLGVYGKHSDIFNVWGNNNLIVNYGRIDVQGEGSSVMTATSLHNKNAILNFETGKIFLKGDNQTGFDIQNGEFIYFHNAGEITLTGEWGKVFYYNGNDANKANFGGSFGSTNVSQQLVGGVFNSGKVTIDGQLSDGFFLAGKNNQFFNLQTGVIETTVNSGMNDLVYFFGNDNEVYNLGTMILNAGKGNNSTDSIMIRMTGKNNYAANSGQLVANAEDTMGVYLYGDGHSFHNAEFGEIHLKGINSIGVLSIEDDFDNKDSYIVNDNLIESESSKTILILANYDHHIFNHGHLETSAGAEGHSFGVVLRGASIGQNEFTNSGMITGMGGSHLYGIVADRYNYIQNNHIIAMLGDYSQGIQLHFDAAAKELTDSIITFNVTANNGGYNTVINEKDGVIAIGYDDPNNIGFMASHAIYGLGQENTITNAGILFVNGKSDPNGERSGAILLKSGDQDTGNNNHVYNAESGLIKAIGAETFAISMEGATGLDISNNGSIMTIGDDSKAIEMMTEHDSGIFNYTSGVISASGENAVGIDISAVKDVFIENEGIVSVDGNQSRAIVATIEESFGILNAGLVKASGNGAIAIDWSQSGGNSQHSLLNTENGIIEGEGYSVLGSEGKDYIINFGFMKGDIDLRGGDDFMFLDTYADISANLIDGGEGYDQFILSGIDQNFVREFSLDDLVNFEKIEIGCDAEGNMILNNQMLWILSGTGHLEHSYMMSGRLALASDVTVTGDYQQLVDTTLYIDIYESGNSETLFVGGTADIQGGYLILVPQVLLPEKAGMEWTIISANQVIGEFDTVNQLFALVEIVQENTGTELKVVTKQVQPFADPFVNDLTPNQRAVADAFDRMVGLGVDPDSEIYDFLVALQGKEEGVYQRYLDQFHGEVYQNLVQSGVEARQMQLDNDMNRLSDALLRCTDGLCDDSFTIFVDGGLNRNDREDFHEDFAEFTTERDSVSAGTVGNIGEYRVGIKVDYADSELKDYRNSDGGDAKAEMTSIGGSIFGAIPVHVGIDLDIRMSLDIARHDVDVERYFDLLEKRTIEGDTDAWTYGGSLEVAHLFEIGESFYVEVSGGMDYVRYDVDGFEESGGGDATLKVDSYNDDQARAKVGTKVGFKALALGALNLSPAVGVSYAHAVTDNVQSHEQCFMNESTHGVCFENFVVSPENMGSVDLSLNANIGGFELGVSASAGKSFGDTDSQDYSIQGEVGYRF